MRKFSRRAISVAAAGGVTLAALTGTVLAAGHGSSNDWPYASTGRSPVLAAVGDIACEPNTDENTANPADLKCGGEGIGGFPAEYATAKQAKEMSPDAVAVLGDEQYQVGKLSDFEQSFEQTWGGLRMLERPAPGNHEYYAYTKHGDNEAAQNGAGYFAYFNGHDANGDPYPQGQAGDDNQGWYSYDLGDWHIISLNAECKSDAFGNSCDPATGVLGQETQWLAQDLAANHSQCTLAYWHQPTFTATGDSGTDAAFASDEGAAADAWWKLLYKNGADLVLGGHEHVYARSLPLDPAGNVDTKKGITQFTVGTGGEDLDTLSSGQALTDEHMVTGEDSAYGVLQLTLNHNGYDWAFRPAAAAAGQPATVLDYSDIGSGRCHGPAA